MSGNARFHDKLHRANHHTLSTSGLLDSAYDPIASPEHPFQGDFVLNGDLSSNKTIYADNLNIKSEIVIDGNTTTQNQKIVGSLQLSKQLFGGTAIYANDPTTNPNSFTLSLNYQNGVFISDDLYARGDLTVNNANVLDLNAAGTLYGNMPTVDLLVTPSTEDISRAYVTLNTNSGYWNDASNWVSTNSADMVVQNLVVMNNITALGSTTLVDLSTSTSDSLCVVNVGLAVPALYAEVVLGSNPILELKHTGDGPIISAQSGGSTFIVNNSGWIGIGGEPSAQLDIYPYDDGANLRLRGALAKDYFINLDDNNLKISHDNSVGGSPGTAVTVTPSNQLGVNTDIFPDPTYKLSVNGGVVLEKKDGTSIKSVLEDASYNDIYTYNDLLAKPYGANTRIFNLSGTKDSPLSGVNSDYIGWSTALYPYVGGSVSDGFGAFGQGGVASINLGYEDLQTTDNLKGLITFNTLCAISGAPTGTPERMRITAEGKVGIGTSTPTSKLHAVGDSDKDINFLTNGTLGVYNKKDVNYAYGFVSVNREHTLFGGNLSLSGETALPIYRKGTNDKAAAGILIKNTNGAGVIPVTKFVYALDTDDASYTVSDSMVISGSNVTIPGDLYLTGTFYGNAAYRALTANWQDTYTTVATNSAINWSYQGADLKSLSGNWESTYTTVSSNSSNWSYDGSDIKTLSSNWQNTYTTVSSNSSNWSYNGSDLKALSGNWQSVYLTVSSLSATWGTGGSDVSSLSSNWQNTYTTVSANSSNWSYQGDDLKSLSSNWQNTYTTLSSNSATWNSVTTYVKFKSYSETSVVSAISSNFISILDLANGTVFPISLDKNITSFELRNIPAGVNSFLLALTQDGTGGKTVAWSFTGKTIKWSGGAPTVTTTANATDIYSFMSIDGNTWYGSVAGKNFV